MANFKGVDYLLIDSQWSGQELLVRQTVRQFVEERLSPEEMIPSLQSLGVLSKR